MNLYRYVVNAPLIKVDPSGFLMFMAEPGPPPPLKAGAHFAWDVTPTVKPAVTEKHFLNYGDDMATAWTDVQVRPAPRAFRSTAGTSTLYTAWWAPGDWKFTVDCTEECGELFSKVVF